MTNLEAVDRFSQTHGANIDKLFWIASSMENSELQETLALLDSDDLKGMFPDLDVKTICAYMEDDEEGVVQLLLDHDKLGFVAEVHLPKCENFTYRNNEPVSCSLNYSISRPICVYGETRDELMIEIEKISKLIFDESVARDRKEKGLK